MNRGRLKNRITELENEVTAQRLTIDGLTNTWEDDTHQLEEKQARIKELEETVVRQESLLLTQRESLVSRRARIEELEADQARMITTMAAGKETKP